MQIKKNIYLELSNIRDKLNMGTGTDFKIRAYEGFEASDYQIGYKQNAQIDSATITSKKVEPREITIEAECTDTLKDKVLRFFNPKMTGKLIVELNNNKRWINYEVKSLKIKQESLYEPIHFIVTLFCAQPFFMDMSDFGKDIAASVPLFAFPFVWKIKIGLLRRHMDVVKLGAAFVVAGVFGSGTDLLFRSFLNAQDGAGVVGIYNAGYMMCMTYAGAFFASMETDYYPRLSMLKNPIGQLNQVVNRQIEVTLLVVAPMLLFFMVTAPFIIPLFYSNDFLEAVPMVRWGMLAMYIRCLVLAIEYVVLSHCKPIVYLLMEGFSFSVLLFSMIVGYLRGGMEGIGVGMFVSGVLELFFVLLYLNMYFRYSISKRVGMIFGFQFLLAMTVVFEISFFPDIHLKLLEAGMVLVSAVFSIVTFVQLISNEKENTHDNA